MISLGSNAGRQIEREEHVHQHRRHEKNGERDVQDAHRLQDRRVATLQALSLERAIATVGKACNLFERASLLGRELRGVGGDLGSANPVREERVFQVAQRG